MKITKTAALIFGPFLIVAILAISAQAGFNDGKTSYMLNTGSIDVSAAVGAYLIVFAGLVVAYFLGRFK